VLNVEHGHQETANKSAGFAFALAAAGCSSGSGAKPTDDANNGKPDTSSMDTVTPVETRNQDTAKEATTEEVPSTLPDTGSPDAAADTTPNTDTGGNGNDAAPMKINALAIGQLTENGQPEIHAPFVMRPNLGWTNWRQTPG